MVKRSRIRAFSDAIARGFHPQKIVLFGSYAYGKPTEDSDVDLLVIMNRTRLKGERMSVRIRHAIPRDFPLDLLVRTPALGRSLAEGLGKHPAALMRGHGSVVVGENLQRAVGRTIYLEMNARMQLNAQLLAGPGGEIVFMDDKEVAANVSWQNYDRAWHLWKTKALAKLEAERASTAAART